MLPQLTVRLVNKTQLSTNTFLLKFLLKNPGGFTFRAGQYVMLKINDANNHPVVRLYSLASKDGEVKDFELIIEPVPGGVASGYFTRLKINDEVNFYGPAGVFALKKTGRPVIFLATGSGVAPIRSMLVSNIKSGNGLYSFFWGLQTKNQVCLFDELKQLEKSTHNFKFYYCLSREPALSFVN